MHLQTAEPELDLPLQKEMVKRVTMQVDTNFIGKVLVPFDIQLQGRFLNVPENFENPLSIEPVVKIHQKLCKDPLSGRLYLCSTVTKE